jgi:hypothetical protein
MALATLSQLVYHLPQASSNGFRYPSRFALITDISPHAPNSGDEFKTYSYDQKRFDATGVIRDSNGEVVYELANEADKSKLKKMFKRMVCPFLLSWQAC